MREGTLRILPKNAMMVDDERCEQEQQQMLRVHLDNVLPKS
jgi:hypothetical protein